MYYSKKETNSTNTVLQWQGTTCANLLRDLLCTFSLHSVYFAYIISFCRFIITCGEDGEVRMFEGLDDDDCTTHMVGETVHAVAYKVGWFQLGMWLLMRFFIRCYLPTEYWIFILTWSFAYYVYFTGSKPYCWYGGKLCAVHGCWKWRSWSNCH